MAPGTHAAIEDLYPLSPMQHGMLFHRVQSMDDAARSGVDIEQMVGALREELDVPAFERAWATITARHPACSWEVSLKR